VSKAPQVFLAHAFEDKERVRALYRKLAEQGLRPWLDEVDLLPGQDWQTAIAHAINESQVVVACISRASVNKHGFVQKEFRLALSAYAAKPAGSIYLIPVRLDDTEVPDIQIPELGVRLKDIHWLDLSVTNSLERLVKAIKLSHGLPADHGKDEGIDVIRGADHVSNWPFEKPCPQCRGTMRLNHDLEEYNCANCEYGEYGP
jgi:TIR domain